MLQISILFILLCGRVWALDNGLALTPPMGFLSWGRFGCNTRCSTESPTTCISVEYVYLLERWLPIKPEQLYMDMADRLAEDGFRNVGFEYVIIDDCWSSKRRDADGKLRADDYRFPHGIKYLADYVHKKGLKLGIYADFGTATCGGYPGSIDYLQLDANTFAEWEVDYLKLDGCNSDIYDMQTGYPEMGKYLNQTGRPIVYSCSWPYYWIEKGLQPDYDTIAATCNLWRDYRDIKNNWPIIYSIMDYFAKNQDHLTQYAGPGHWNDPDQLLIGNSGLTINECEAQMAIWSILAAPLLISTDLRTLSKELRDIYLNEKVIAVNQDALGIQGKRIAQEKVIDIWTRPVLPLSPDSAFYSWAVAFLNNAKNATSFSTSLKDIGLNNAKGYRVTDLFTGFDYGILIPDDTVDLTIKAVGVVFLKADVFLG